MTQNVDLVIIGGGTGGYVAALRASQLGMKTVLIERDAIGGISINSGGLPMKALLRSIEVFRLCRHASSFGIMAKGVDFDLRRVVERARGIASQASYNIRQLLKKNKVDVIEARGRLLGKGKVEAVDKDGNVLSDYAAKHILIATGAKPRELPGMESDDKLVWSYKKAIMPDMLPKTLLVVGAGSAGVEFACLYRALGVDVSLIEVGDRILPNEDEEISSLARKALDAQGIRIITGAMVKRFDKNGKSVGVTIEQGVRTSISPYDRVIMAVGIVGNTEGLGLENTRVKIDKGHIETSEWGVTDESGIYAIGDVTGAPWVAQKASHQAMICVDRMAGTIGIQPVDLKNIPSCIYAWPQIASIGLTEVKARAAGHEIRVGRFPFAANGKANAISETEGLIKTIFDADTGAFLGAHMIGPDAAELIQSYAVARAFETTERELLNITFPQGTLSSALGEAVLSAYGRAIHS